MVAVCKKHRIHFHHNTHHTSQHFSRRKHRAHRPMALTVESMDVPRLPLTTAETTAVSILCADNTPRPIILGLTSPAPHTGAAGCSSSAIKVASSAQVNAVYSDVIIVPEIQPDEDEHHVLQDIRARILDSAPAPVLVFLDDVDHSRNDDDDDDDDDDGNGNDTSSAAANADAYPGGRLLATVAAMLEQIYAPDPLAEEGDQTPQTRPYAVLLAAADAGRVVAAAGLEAMAEVVEVLPLTMEEASALVLCVAKQDDMVLQATEDPAPLLAGCRGDPVALTHLALALPRVSSLDRALEAAQNNSLVETGLGWALAVVLEVATPLTRLVASIIAPMARAIPDGPIHVYSIVQILRAFGWEEELTFETLVAPLIEFQLTPVFDEEDQVVSMLPCVASTLADPLGWIRSMGIVVAYAASLSLDQNDPFPQDILPFLLRNQGPLPPIDSWLEFLVCAGYHTADVTNGLVIPTFNADAVQAAQCELIKHLLSRMPDADLATPSGLRLLGLRADAMEDSPERIAAFTAVVAAATELEGPNSMRVATALSNRGSIEQKLGDLEAAVATFTHARTVLESLEDPSPVMLGILYNNMGDCFREAGLLDQARDLLSQALAIRTACHGSESARVAVTHRNLSLLAMTAEQWESALAHLTTSLTLFETIHNGPCHASVDIQADLALVHTKLGNAEQAAQATETANTLLEQEHW